MSQKYCIFCGQSGLTKEHFWPDWLRMHIDPDSSTSYFKELHVADGDTPSSMEEQLERPGHLMTIKFRVVCRACNNGWMSRLESDVKPLLLAMMRNGVTAIKECESMQLARWVVMKVLVSEQSDENALFTPESDRMAFGKNQVIPDYFRVYVGRHMSSDQVGYLRRSATVSETVEGPKSDMRNLKRNIQTVCFIVDTIVFFVLACRESQLKIWRRFNLSPLICILPTEKTIRWKKVQLIDKQKLGQVAHALGHLIESKNVKRIGSHSKH